MAIELQSSIQSAWYLQLSETFNSLLQAKVYCKEHFVDIKLFYKVTDSNVCHSKTV